MRSNVKNLGLEDAENELRRLSEINSARAELDRLRGRKFSMTRILFVCHGNICRSVGAQYILQNLVNRKKLAKDFLIDSAATSTEEIGNPIYPPMKAALERAHIPIGAHRARQLRREDYSLYDLFIGMDEENEYYMRQILGKDPDSKIHYLMEYTDSPEEIIEDPWYTRKFDHCTDQLKRGCQGLLAHLVMQTSSSNSKPAH